MFLIPRDAPIVILTGAGISRESGLHTFRDPDGIILELQQPGVPGQIT